MRRPCLLSAHVTRTADARHAVALITARKCIRSSTTSTLARYSARRAAIASTHVARRYDRQRKGEFQAGPAGHCA